MADQQPQERKPVIFIAKDGMGRSVICRVLMTFTHEGKHYLAYTDESTDEDGAKRVFGCFYDPESMNNHIQMDTTILQMTPFENKADWDVLNAAFTQVTSQQQRQEQDQQN